MISGNSWILQCMFYCKFFFFFLLIVTCLTTISPDIKRCRLYPVVVVVVGLVCVNDPWGNAVEPLMPDRSKMRSQTKRDTGVYAARGRRNSGRGPPTSLKKAELEEVGVWHSSAHVFHRGRNSSYRWFSQLAKTKKKDLIVSDDVVEDAACFLRSNLFTLLLKTPDYSNLESQTTARHSIP